MICNDFLEFQDALKKMRTIDDKILYVLNTSIPTESFRGKTDVASVCKDLYNEISKGHKERETAIKNCIVMSAENVKCLKAQKTDKPHDIETLKNYKAEQTKLRLLQTELSVEEVIKDKTSKVFKEKCRMFYKPPQES